MELYQLRAFVATAETGQVTKAAQRLHVTQPAVSAQIKALEQELGVPLFERMGNGVLLTRAGRELLEHARSVLAASGAVIAHGRKLREGGCQELRLGTVLHPQFIRLGRLVRELLDDFPLLQLKLRHGPSGNVIDGSVDGELDAAFCVGDLKRTAVSYMHLAWLDYCVVGAASCWPQIEHASLEKLCELPWLAAPQTSTQSVLLEQLFKGRSVMPPQIVEVDQETTRICMILEGIGLALMRKELARRFQREGKVVIWSGKGPTTQFSFAHLADRQDDLVLKRARDLVARLWQTPANAVDFDSRVASVDIPFSYEPAQARGAKGG
jgi:DNA-binding transcriptional LysR family regulator